MTKVVKGLIPVTPALADMLLRQEISLEVIYVEAVTPKHFNYIA